MQRRIYVLLAAPMLMAKCAPACAPAPAPEPAPVTVEAPSTTPETAPPATQPPVQLPPTVPVTTSPTTSQCPLAATPLGAGLNTSWTPDNLGRPAITITPWSTSTLLRLEARFGKDADLHWETVATATNTACAKPWTLDTSVFTDALQAHGQYAGKGTQLPVRVSAETGSVASGYTFGVVVIP